MTAATRAGSGKLFIRPMPAIIGIMLRIGYHLSVAGGLDLAFDRAVSLSSTAMQIFVSNPRGWQVRYPSAEIAERFARKRDKSGVEVCCHMPYLPNLGSANEQSLGKTLRSLSSNLEICSSLGIQYLVTHLGSHMGTGRGQGLRNVINALESTADSAKDVMILLENQAGHANSIGARLSDLLYIYDNCSMARKGKLGFCLDTCHLFAAGYDVRDEEVLDSIGSELGYGKVFAYHMNDAKFPLGSNRDRHENIGKGYIGAEGFRTMLGHRGIREKMLILETPYEALVPDGRDLAMLRELAGSNKE